MSSKELLFDTFSYDYETIGKLRFRRYNDLLGAEAAQMDGLQREMTQASLQMMTLAKRISDKQGISFDEAFDMLATGEVTNVSLLADFADEAFILLNSLPRRDRIDDEIITLFICSRAEIEGPEGWQPFEDWNIEDTRRVPQKFRAEIRAFVDREQAGESKPAAAGRRGKTKPAS
jgi:hypothetical protein